MAALASLVLVAACNRPPPPPEDPVKDLGSAAEYQIGPLDTLEVFVWGAPDLSRENTQVRPDGRISMPLVGDVQAAGVTPTVLGDAIAERLETYVQNPQVTVSVTSFGDAAGQTVRVVGEAGRPVAVPYRAGMQVLDVMVAAGGLSEFAAGNDAVLIRGRGGQEKIYGLRLDDLLNEGDTSANSLVLPGDVILVPKSLF
jgi:polysaccharide export outer membrane protein